VTGSLFNARLLFGLSGREQSLFDVSPLEMKPGAAE